MSVVFFYLQQNTIHHQTSVMIGIFDRHAYKLRFNASIIGDIVQFIAPLSRDYLLGTVKAKIDDYSRHHFSN